LYHGSVVSSASVNFSMVGEFRLLIALLNCVNVWRGYKEEELNTYMEGLHAYNEMKDIGQMLLGRLGKLQSEKDALAVTAALDARGNCSPWECWLNLFLCSSPIFLQGI